MGISSAPAEFNAADPYWTDPLAFPVASLLTESGRQAFFGNERNHEIIARNMKVPIGSVPGLIDACRHDPASLEAYATGVLEEAYDKEGDRQMIELDRLTGLPNQVTWINVLRRQVREAERHEADVAVLLIDLDGFKRLNDQIGHDKGDDLLRAVAGAMRSEVRSGSGGRPGDVLTHRRYADARTFSLSRLGGDEFGVALSIVGGQLPPAEVAGLVARRLTTRFEAIMRPYGFERLGATTGIAVWVPGITTTELVRRADSALRVAKDAARQARFEALGPDQQRAFVAARALLVAAGAHLDPRLIDW